MSHGYTASDQMFSVRQVPWMQGERTTDGLAVVNVQVLPDYPGREDAVRLAGLDWQVEESEAFRRIERDRDGLSTVTYPKLVGWKVLTRSDSNDVLHVAKDTYGVVQNDVGFDILEQLLDADGNVRYETGGSIKGGAVCYLCARIDEPFVVDGDDSVTFPYAVVTWAHDGSAAVQARATTVRVVCANTISASEAEARRTGRRFTFRHTKNVLSRIEDAKKALSGIREETAAFQELANELAALPITEDQRERFVTTFIPAPEADVVSDRVLDNISKARSQVRGLFEGVTIPEKHKDTAYGLVLAGVEYLDHLRGSRNSDTYLNRTLLREEALKAKLVPMVRELAGASR